MRDCTMCPPAPSRLQGPYPGLRAFHRSEAPIFFGRDEQIDGLLERLETARLVVVAGESGCGKSSLVRAGLLPALDAGFLYGGGSTWYIADLRPGSRPIYNLASALVAALQPGPASPLNAELLAARLRRGPRSIGEVLKDCGVPPSTEILIVVDQFEELIRFRARTDPDEADAFVALLLASVADKTIAARVVLTLRSDYLGACAIFPGLPEALNGSQYLVPRLGREQLRETIVNPARVFDGDVDPVLANQLINEIGQSQDQLPVLEHALLSMWVQQQSRVAPRASDSNNRGGGPPVSLAIDDYTALGGLSEALSRHADVVYGALADDEKRRIASRLFCALWDEGASSGDTRRPCTIREAADIAGVTTDELKQVAEAFRTAEHSFLMPPPDVALTDDTVLDVGHESLFRAWTRLKTWIRQEEEDAEHFRRWCGLAAARRQDNGDLLSGRTLDRALAWRATVKPNAAWASRYTTRPGDFADVEQFLSDSQTAEITSRRRQSLARAGLCVLGLVFVIAVVRMLVSDTRMAAEHRRTAEVKELARQQRYSAAAFSVARSEPVHALQLALEAHGEGDHPQAEAALRSALRSSHFRALVHASLGYFDSARFLPDGRRVVTVGSGDGLAVWDVQSGRRLRAFRGYAPTKLAIDTTGRLAATASEDGSVDLWDLTSEKQLWTRHGQVAQVTAIAFSPDSSTLATASEDGTAVLWDAKTGETRHRLVDHVGALSGLAFSHDGGQLATAGVDDRILLWDARSGRKLREFIRERDLSSLAFNATGEFFAAASGTNVLLWDPITQRLLGSLPHANRISAVVFSPDGHRLATAGLDGTLRIWDASERRELLQISPDLALNRAGRQAVAASASQLDGLILDSWLLTAAFSDDGRQLVTTGLDGTAKIWDVESGGELEAFRAHEQSIRAIAYSPGGDRVATAGGTAAVWDAAGKLLFRTPSTNDTSEDSVNGVAFIDAGRQLLASAGNQLAVWDIAAKSATGAALTADARIQEFDVYHRADRVAIAAGHRVSVWSLADRKQAFTLDAKAELFAIAVSPDDNLIASECREPAAEDADAKAPRQLCLWNAHSGAKVAALGMPPQEPRSDGAPQPVTTDAHFLPILHLCFSADGTWLASASQDNAVKIWDLTTMRFKMTLVGHRDSVVGIAISPDGQTIASAGHDWVRLWNTSAHVAQDGFSDTEYGATSVAFSPDGQSLAAGGADGVVRVYSVKAAALTPIARSRTPLRLTDEECRQYGNEPCHEPRTALQLANEGRRILRKGASALGRQYLTLAALADPAAYANEAARFAGALSFQHAAKDAADQFHRALSTSLDTLPAGDEGRTQIARRLADASQLARSRGEAALTQAQSLDTGVVFDPAHLISEITTATLMACAKGFVEQREKKLAMDALGLVPALAEGGQQAESVANDLTNAWVIRAVNDHLQNENPTQATEVLDSLSIDTRLPQALVLLRFLLKTYDSLHKADEVTGFAERLYPLVNDPDLLVELADLLFRTGKAKLALSTVQRVLSLDPANDKALLLLGTSQAASGQPGAAVATLRKVSPLAGFYKQAISQAGAVAYDKLRDLNEGYRFMVESVEPQDPDSWANLAEAAWGTRRFLEAQLIAHRVLEARIVRRSSLDVECAMRFVLVASLSQSGEFAAAESELETLVANLPAVKSRSWDYSGSRAAALRIKDAHARRFIQALLVYMESRGSAGDPDSLRRRLHEARDAGRR